LIVDEITMGFRLNLGGSHMQLGLEPDLAVFAKGMSNGFPMAALVGKTKIMQSIQETFISSTFWTERIGPTAALATIKKLRRENVAEQLAQTGRRIFAGWKEAAAAAGLDIVTGGVDPLPHFAIQGESAQSARTLFTQEMLRRGFLAGAAVYVTLAHRPEAVENYLNACREVFALLANALRNKTVASLLNGPVAHSGFSRLT
jgi:glutamate-1-semialdehyde aminotransferase